MKSSGDFRSVICQKAIKLMDNVTGSHALRKKKSLSNVKIENIQINLISVKASWDNCLISKRISRNHGNSHSYS